MSVRTVPLPPLPATWRVRVFSTRAEAEEATAALLVDAFSRPSTRSVVVPSGSTFKDVYADLARRVAEGRADWSHVRFGHLDEFVGVRPFEPGSLSGEIKSALFADGDLRRGVFDPIDATHEDAAGRLESSTRGADLLLLGLGRNGHVAFNEPGSAIGSVSRRVALAPETIRDYAARFGSRASPTEAFTVGLATIASARRVVLLATGAAKARAVADMLLGPIDPARPATSLRLVDHVEIVLDEDAASLVRPNVVARTESEHAEAHGRPSPSVLRPTLIEVAGKDHIGALLVVAPHPDDASISAGGLIAMISKCARAVVATFSTGARAAGPWKTAEEATSVREAEARAEAADLGAEARFLRAAAYTSGVFEPADAEAILRLLRETKPRWVILPARDDPHPTHRLCRLTAEEAVRRWVADDRVARASIWTSEGPWRLLATPEIDSLVVLDAEAVEVKRRAMSRHRSQMERVPFDKGADALEILRAIGWSETKFGGKVAGGFDKTLRVEAYSVLHLEAAPEPS